MTYGMNGGATMQSSDQALHEAVASGDAPRVKALLEAGADPNLFDVAGSRPLHVAARTGNDEVVGLLLDKGADVNERDGAGCAALHWAARYGHVQVAHRLLHAGARRNNKSYDNGLRIPLHMAVQGGDQNAPMVALLLAKLGREQCHERAYEGSTPLHLAATGGHMEIAKLLVNAGADVLATHSSMCSTPEHLALANGHVALAAMLHALGIEANRRSRDRER